MTQLAIPSTGSIRRLDVASSARFEKDILRADDYRVGDRLWHVDGAKLREIESNFRRAKANGNTIPVQWGHSDDARDRLGDVLDLEVRGDTLFAIFDSKSPDDAKKLGVTANEVSVEVREPWTDGKGNVYPTALTHLAVVNLPVVPNQGPMLRLSLISGGNMSTKTRRLATGDSEAVDGEGGDNTMISVKEVVAMLKEAGKSLPDEVKTADELKLAWKVLNPSAAPEEKPAEEEAASMSDLPVVQASLIRERDALRAEVAGFKAQQESAYRGELEQLVVQGSLLAADRENLLAVGKSTSWNLSTLEPFKRIKAGSAVKTTSKVRQLSTLGNQPEETPEQRRERARAAFK